MNISINTLTCPLKSWKSESPAGKLKISEQVEIEAKKARHPKIEKDIYRASEQFCHSSSLKDVHYQAMNEQREKMIRLGYYKPAVRHVSAISGYGGFIPHKESYNVLGSSYRKANEIAAEIGEKLKK